MSELKMDIGYRIGDGEEYLRRCVENKMDNLRVTMPGVIVDFDASKQTATVQPLIKEYVRGEWLSLPRLLDVPCYFPRAGGYCLSFPVKPGDEVQISFNDMCIDSWWQSGGEQTQPEIRRHDLSDAMCFLGITSAPKAVKDYSTNSIMLRNEDKDSYFEIVDDNKTLNIIGAEKLNITTEDDINITTGADLNITTSADINIKAAANITIESDANITIKAAGDIDLEADGNMRLKAARIDLNEE